MSNTINNIDNEKCIIFITIKHYLLIIFFLLLKIVNEKNINNK